MTTACATFIFINFEQKALELTLISHAQVVCGLYSLRNLYPGDDMFTVVPNWRSIKSPQSTVEEVLNSFKLFKQ